MKTSTPRRPRPKATKTAAKRPSATKRPSTKRPPSAPAENRPAADEKLQKVLARAGFGSRREMERWIEEGRVSIDGKKAALGDRVGAEQAVRVDGHLLSRIATRGARRRVLLYHKPEGEVTTRSDPQGRPTVFEHLPVLRTGRWVAIGRLDINTSGLLLFTTDGELAHRLMHPSAGVEREYAVRVLGQVDPTMLARLKEGVELDDGTARFESVEDAGGTGSNRWYHVMLKEGRYREVRRLWEAVGATVSRLIRFRYGPVSLPRGLRAGRWQELDRDAMQVLYGLAGLEEAAPESRPQRRPGVPPNKRHKVRPQAPSRPRRKAAPRTKRAR